jgi:hypothetical protein
MPLNRALRYGGSNKYTGREVQQLISKSPESSRHANSIGEMPLDLALKNQCPFEAYFYILIKEHESAAASIDPVQNITTFMLAAIKRGVHGKQGEYTSCLISTFDLLRTNPGML